MKHMQLVVVGVSLGLACGGDRGASAGGTEEASSTEAMTTGTGDGPTSTSGATTTTTTGPTTTAGPTSTGEPETGSTTAMPVDTSTSTSESDSDSDTSTGEPDPGVAEVHYVGRHDASDPSQVRMGWSGVGLVFRFEGTDASVTMDDAARYFTVVVDGEVQPTLATMPGEHSYPLAVGLPAGEHTIELYRQTEGSFGMTVVLGIDLAGGELLPPPPVTRRIEVIGDSISCGYGNEGEAPCSFSAETENHYLTYGAVAARSFGAELSTIAWSGKGVVYNYGDDKNNPLPAIYDRTLPTEASPWSFAWQPDVVVINLGTNDFSTDDDPPAELFVPAYVELLTTLRGVYPDAFILPVAPLLFGDEAVMVQGYLEDAVAQRHADGDLEVAFANINVQWVGSGCDGHPNVATHLLMADALVAAVQEHVGW